MQKNLFFFPRKKENHAGKGKKPIAFPKEKKMKKSAQMKIQQMAFVLIAVTLLFVLFGLFITAFMFSDLKNSAGELGNKNALLLVSRLANSPELSCGNVFGISGLNCVDSDKAMMLVGNIERYENFWGVGEIQIRKISDPGEKQCSLGNYPDCDFITVYSKEVNKGAPYSNFISLCRKEAYESEVYNKCELARLIVFPIAID